MKNFKKYLVLALCFGLVLSSINAGITHDLRRAIKNKDLNTSLALIPQVKDYYEEDPNSFSQFVDLFQEAFGQSIEEAQANARGEGTVGLMRERDQAEEERDSARRYVRDLEGNLHSTQEDRQEFERQLREEQRQKQKHQEEMAKIKAEERATRLKLLSLQEEMAEKAQMAQRKAQEDQNVASSSTDDLNTNLQAENAKLYDLAGTLQEEQAATLQQLQACQRKNAELAQKVSEQSAKIYNLDKALSAFRTISSKGGLDRVANSTLSKSDADFLNAKIEELKAEIVELQKRNTALEMLNEE